MISSVTIIVIITLLLVSLALLCIWLFYCRDRVNTNKPLDIAIKRSMRGGNKSAPIPRSFAQVFTLTPAILHKIDPNDYVYSYKIDGIRTELMLANDKYYKLETGYGKPKQTLILTQSPTHVTNAAKDTYTVVSCEQIEVDNKPFFIIFDAHIINGRYISQYAYTKRLAMISTWIVTNGYTNMFINSVYNITSMRDLIHDVLDTSKELLDVISLPLYNEPDSIITKIIEEYAESIGKQPALNTLKRYITVKIDGIVIQHKNDPSTVTKAYKLKRPQLNTIDFLLKYVKDDNGEWCYHMYSTIRHRDIPFICRLESRENVYNTVNDACLVRYISPFNLSCDVFKPTLTYDTTGYTKEMQHNIKSIVEDMLQEPMRYNDLIVELSYTNDNLIVPLRIRTDKVLPNGYYVAISNESLRFAPLTCEESYFNIIDSTTIHDTWHNVVDVIRRYTIEHTLKDVKQLNRRINILDLCGGRGGDFKRVMQYLNGCDVNIVAIDSDREALVSYVAKNSSLYFKATRSYVNRDELINSGALLTALYHNFDSNVEHTTDIINTVKSLKEYPKDGFDVILMDHAINYFVHDDKCLQQLSYFIKSLLSTDGKFVITRFDGDKFIENAKDNTIHFNSFDITINNDHKTARLPFPTIDKDGYRDDNLVYTTHIDSLNMNKLEHFNVVSCLDKDTLLTVDPNATVTDYLSYVCVDVLYNEAQMK